MSHETYTTLKCNNPDAVDACATVIRNYFYGEIRKKSDTEIYAKTIDAEPHNEVQRISKKFPNDVITCWYSYECSDGSERNIVEYSNGEHDLLDLIPVYIHNITIVNDKDRASITDKASAFFRRLDTTDTDKDGKMLLNWFNYKESVCYTFEYDCADGKKYRIEATKVDREINYKIYEGLAK